mgnify:FL=1
MKQLYAHGKLHLHNIGHLNMSEGAFLVSRERQPPYLKQSESFVFNRLSETVHSSGRYLHSNRRNDNRPL